MDIEDKLKEYRRKKQREERLQQVKIVMNKWFTKYFKRNDKKLDTTDLEETLLSKDQEEYENPDIDHLALETVSNDSFNDDDNINCSMSWVDITFYFLCFTLWCTLYGVFIKLEFGIVYFLLSAIVGIYLNTRTRPRRQGEISAYSVFNRNCKSIDGTLKAEQFENEMRYGFHSVR